MVWLIFVLCLSLSHILYSSAIIPASRARASLTFVRRSEAAPQIKKSSFLNSLKIRGGSSSEYDLEESDEDSDDEYDEEEESDDGDEYDEEGDEEEESDEEQENVPSLPVKITLKTALSSNILIDQSIEITASPTRSVESLKQSVSRQFKSRPPMNAITLRLDGQILDDSELVTNLVEDEDEEEEDDDDEDGLSKLTIIVDMVPPVDPKFGTEMKSRINDLTNEEVLNAYVANLASMHQNSVDIMKEDNIQDSVREIGGDEDEDEEDEEISSSTSRAQTNLEMQRYIHMLKERIVESLSSDEKELLERTDTPSSPEEEDLDSYDGDILLKESIKRKKRSGGATMNVKRALQKNLNINWPDTIRNFLLFLFFGYFGGRNAMSRTIMLLGAPACFIIQARPVKVAIKQLFYTIGEPPGILLSLLPAPQQAIMSCHYDDAMRFVYGEKIDSCNDMINDSEAKYQPMEDFNDASEDEYDEYDEDY